MKHIEWERSVGGKGRESPNVYGSRVLLSGMWVTNSTCYQRNWYGGSTSECLLGRVGGWWWGSLSVTTSVGEGEEGVAVSVIGA